MGTLKLVLWGWQCCSSRAVGLVREYESHNFKDVNATIARPLRRGCKGLSGEVNVTALGMSISEPSDVDVNAKIVGCQYQQNWRCQSHGFRNVDFTTARYQYDNDIGFCHLNFNLYSRRLVCSLYRAHHNRFSIISNALVSPASPAPPAPPVPHWLATHFLRGKSLKKRGSRMKIFLR